MHKDNKVYVLKDGVKGYEKKDVIARPIIAWFAILVVTTVVCALVAEWCWVRWQRADRTDSVVVLPVAELRTLPPLPRLQAQPPLDIAAFHKHEQEKIKSYAWIDKQAQIVQIPVDHALEIVAEKGLPHGREAHIPGKSQQAGTPAAAPAPAGAPAPAVTEVPAATPGTSDAGSL